MKVINPLPIWKISVRHCRLSCICFLCKLCPLCCSVGFFISIIVINWILFHEFVSFSYDSVLDLYSTRVEDSTRNFFEEKLAFFDLLGFDLEQGNYDDQDDVDVYERFFYSRFKMDRSITAFYTIFSNNQTLKLHREEPGYLGTQIRVYENETFQYRYDRLREPIDTDMSNFELSPISYQSYIPYLKDWFIQGSDVYPSGYWDGPSFSDPECNELWQIPVYIYVHKYFWKNDTKFSVHKVKFRTSDIAELMSTIFDELPREKIDFALISENYDVLSCRNIEEQVTPEGDAFRKIWELEDDYFKKLEEEPLSKAVENKIAGKDEREDNPGFSTNIAIVPLGEESNHWVLVLHVDKGKYFESVMTTFVISMILSILVLVLYSALTSISACAICHMFCTENIKRKKIKIIKRMNMEINIEKENMKNLIQSLVPSFVVQRLLEGETSIVGKSDRVSVFFLDVSGFTVLTQSIQPEILLAVLQWIFLVIDMCSEKWKIYKIKTIGDCYMGCKGLQELENSEDDHENYSVTEVLKACVSMIQLLRMKAIEISRKGGRGKSWRFANHNLALSDILSKVDYRVGLHVGFCLYGIIEEKSARFDIWGNTVNYASRLEGSGKIGYVHFSEDVYKEVVKEKNIKKFSVEKNKVQLKGFEGAQNTFFTNFYDEENMSSFFEGFKFGEMKIKMEEEEEEEGESISDSSSTCAIQSKSSSYEGSETEEEIEEGEGEGETETENEEGEGEKVSLEAKENEEQLQQQQQKEEEEEDMEEVARV